MGIAFGILVLGGTEPEIHLGVNYPPNCNVRFKNTIATLGLKCPKCYTVYSSYSYSILSTF